MKKPNPSENIIFKDHLGNIFFKKTLASVLSLPLPFAKRHEEDYKMKRHKYVPV